MSNQPANTKPSPAMPAATHTVAIRYLESSPIQVRGQATGRQYAFSRDHPIQSVEARDAEALLRTRFFRRQG